MNPRDLQSPLSYLDVSSCFGWPTFFKPAHVMNNSWWLCAAKPHHILETMVSVWMASPGFAPPFHCFRSGTLRGGFVNSPSTCLCGSLKVKISWWSHLRGHTWFLKWCSDKRLEANLFSCLNNYLWVLSCWLEVMTSPRGNKTKPDL